MVLGLKNNLICGVISGLIPLLGWNEPVATSAPVQDEAIQAILRLNQKHILFPYPRIFQPPSLPQNFPLLPTSPPPTSFISFPNHSISRAWESSWAWIAQSFEETWDTRLEKGGEFNVEGMWKGESKRSTYPKCRNERKNVSSLLFLYFFSFLLFFIFVFFFFFFYLKRKRCPRKKCLKLKGRCRKPKAKAKNERAKQKLEGKLLPFFAFFFLPMVFFFVFLFFLLLEKKRMPT